MNAEKVLGIAVCAFACATGSAFANTTNSWFGVKPSIQCYDEWRGCIGRQQHYST